MPELRPDLAPYWQAYLDLSPSRAWGIEAGPIPLSEIAAYCALIGLDGREERLRLARMVRAMDEEYLDYRRRNARG